jgi:uncharacterized protein (TIGR02246 family)
MERTRSPGKLLAARRVLGVLALLGALAGCNTTGASDAPAFVGEIEALNRRMEELFRAGDLLGVADVFADDGVLLDARGVRTAGREEIDAFWSAIENPLDWRLSIKRIRGSDAIAYELGSSRMTTLRDGARVNFVSDFLILWRREPDGSWRIELDAFWPREGR